MIVISILQMEAWKQIIFQENINAYGSKYYYNIFCPEL